MGLHKGSQKLQTHGHRLGKQSPFHLIDTLALGKCLVQKFAHPLKLLMGLDKVEFFY